MSSRQWKSMFMLKSHYGIDPISFHYGGRSGISQSSYGVVAQGRNYSQSLLTSRVHCKRHVKMHLYQSYNALLHMATIACPFLRILPICLLNCFRFIKFLSKLSLFTTTITTRILPFL